MSENNTDTLKNWLIILALIFILTVMGVVWLFLFSDFAFFNAKGLDTSNRIDYGAKVLTTIGTIFGGLAVLINAYYAAKRWEAMDKSAMAANESAKAALKNAEAALKNAVIAEDKQITERFAKAIEQLGSEKIEVRLGAIYTLERIAKDSAKDHWTIMEILTAFVRENVPRKLEEENTENTQQIPKIRTDIQAALTVIGRRNCDNEQENQRLDLSNIDIREADLYNANLQQAYLYNANLQRVNLKGAKLQGAGLDQANLQGAVLVETNLQLAVLRKAKLQEASLDQAKLQKAGLFEANLQGVVFGQANLQGAFLNKANLQRTILSGANLERADLREANLQGATLTGVQNLEQRQIDLAKGDRTTILPDYLEYPEHWQ
ncbi:pentapeptide repeat-containing protein [Nostoc sp. HK-01]|uniref:Pentapeptide repeat-containing protein n=1 Tax=Anabaenopsis circularis NIES-21 TaxID=1085406 RepID=A0A1Z4GBT8_9CYAN|nr:pentapeptide repeat-containing protein [Anabaenopsis circularis NIES-21]BBD61199.1 pentapeptide repeat-containing protein [Nostoc sp. HK-01]